MCDTVWTRGGGKSQKPSRHGGYRPQDGCGSQQWRRSRWRCWRGSPLLQWKFGGVAAGNFEIANAKSYILVHFQLWSTPVDGSRALFAGYQRPRELPGKIGACGGLESKKLNISMYTVNQYKHTEMFLSYLLQQPADADKLWCALSWINLRYSSLKVFQLTWTMLQHYLVKLSIHDL